jgi:hypothetical protein
MLMTGSSYKIVGSVLFIPFHFVCSVPLKTVSVAEVSMPENPQVSLIKQSDIFDERYYLDQVDGPRELPGNSIEHYLAVGAARGLNPHPLFNSKFYLNRYPDVSSAGMNPLVHYISHGASEGRFPNDFFDSGHYLASLPESERFGVNPLTHYLRSPIAAKHSTHAQFDTQLYLTFYPEVLVMGYEPLVHYLEKGAMQKRLAHIEFDPQFYLDTYKDVFDAGLDPVQHFNVYGRAEGRLARSTKQRFQSLECFEEIFEDYVYSDSAKQNSARDSKIDMFRQHITMYSSRKVEALPFDAAAFGVFWGAPLFDRRLIEQFLEVVRKLPEINFFVHKGFIGGDSFVGADSDLPANVLVLDAVSSKQDLFAGCSLFVSPVECSPVSELMLGAIESELLVVCSDDSEWSRVISPSEAILLPQGINAEKLVHAVTYAFANLENSASRAAAAHLKLWDKMGTE